ncbi:hypothetical protein GBAR_LOCUS5506 [Geodia barretti]|uniref:Uncharacterized protein n=1 Tax=Geodia barretti TaxID=519541 RepID=A0AA35RAP7_GEOBA|nr:hypothetical protein GBAR_LOCUS5506 [Geodia barretti]
MCIGTYKFYGCMVSGYFVKTTVIYWHLILSEVQSSCCYVRLPNTTSKVSG